MLETPILPAELTIYTAGEVHPLWRTWLAEADHADAPPECRVDAAAVDQIDGAGLQLLISLANSLGARQRTLRLVGASPLLVNACQTLGLASLLEPTPCQEVAA